jgi:hypothetical protein
MRIEEGEMAITRSNARGVFVQRRKNVSVLTPRARMSAWESEGEVYRFGQVSGLWFGLGPDGLLSLFF